MRPVKRKASFIGSEEWRKKDVEVTTHGDPYDIGIGDIRLKDKPSGIWVQVAQEPPTSERADSTFALLAHRVKQLS